MVLKKNGRLDLEPDDPDDLFENGGDHDSLNDDSPDQDDPGDQEDPGGQEHPDDQGCSIFYGDMISGTQGGPFVSSPGSDILPPDYNGGGKDESCTDEADMRNMQPLGDDFNDIDIDNIELGQPNILHNVADRVDVDTFKVSFPKRVPLIKDKLISKKKK